MFLPPLPEYWLSLSFDKWWLSKVLGISDDALHVHGGLLVLMFAALVLRRPPWTWRPWLVVVVFEFLNEFYDLFQGSHPTLEANLRASAHDFWLTLVWPTVILLIFPRLIRRYARA